LSGAARAVALALDALRHGWAIRVEGEDGALDLLPAETAFVQPGLYAARLLISHARAATLKLANQRDAAAPHMPVMIHGAEPFSLHAARSLADPALDLAEPLRGPFRADRCPAQAAAVAAMELARLAGILPAFMVATGVEPAAHVTPADLAAFKDPLELTIQARARLPVEPCEQAEIVAFRARDDLREHVALVIGTQSGDHVPLVRLHSECLTGDVLGSLKCDCGPQLHSALDRIAQAPVGLVLYLRQEGRGIGLGNKLKAYALQAKGMDTVEANVALGFAPDERDFDIAAKALKTLGVTKVRLITNNPDKVEALRSAEIETERVTAWTVERPENSAYLAAKRAKMGHIL
jgi:GTP cyclohydrolase II